MGHDWTSKGMIKNNWGMDIRWIFRNCRAIYGVTPIQRENPNTGTWITSDHDPRIEMGEKLTCEEYMLFNIHVE